MAGDDRMHVLFTYLEDVICSPPGHSLSREISETSASLVRLGVQVTILTLGSEEEAAGHLGQHLLRFPAPPLRVIPVTRLKEMRHQALLQSNLSLLARVASLQLQGRAVDLVHCFGWEAGLASGLISQMTGAPLVSTIQDVIVERTPWLTDPHLAYPRSVERWLIRHSHRLICPDSYARDKIRDLFLVKDKDLFIVSPISAKVHLHSEREVFPEKREPKVLYIGSLNSESGVYDLLWACSRLVARHVPHLRLLLVTCAEPPQDLLIRKMIRKLQLAEHVQLLNLSNLERTPERFLQQANLLVMPGRAEFVGNLVLEAMDFGLPVVTANCGALAQLIEDGVNGLKFPFGEGRGLVDAMEAILLNPGLHRQLAGGARREVGRRPEVGPLLLKIYQETLAGPPQSKREGGEIDELLFAESGGGGEI